MLRKDIPENRTWDTTGLYANEEAFEKALERANELLKEFDAYQGKLNKDNAIDCLNLTVEAERLGSRLYVYAMMKRDENTALPENQARIGKVHMLLTMFSSKLSFISPELSALDDSVLEEMKNDAKYADFSVVLYDIIRQKKHILSEKEEKVLAEVSAFSSGYQEVFTMFDNADLKFDDVLDSEGKSHPLSHGNYAVYLESKDPVLRKNAFKEYYKRYIAFINTVGTTYISSVKKDSALAKIRKYESALASALFNEDVPVEVYNNLVESVRKNTPKMHEYIKLRKEILGLDEMHMYDMYVALSKDVTMELEYEDAYELVCKALAPLGDEYNKILKKAYKNRWIDVYETENKRSGAYSVSIYDHTPFVLLNYTKTTSDIFTIAHEMGHAIHSYMSNAAQPFSKADYKIFVAEVASTVNEVLMLKYLLKSADEKMREFLLNYFISMVRTTLFRQTMFAEFEKFAHETYEQLKPVTPDLLNEEYLRLNKAYYGPGVEHDKEISYEWMRIPHFYRAFYVYKYATGITAAINIANKVLEEGADYVPKYFKMLSAGCSLPPVEILKLADVDLMSEEPFEIAMNEFASAVNELKKLKSK